MSAPASAGGNGGANIRSLQRRRPVVSIAGPDSLGRLSDAEFLSVVTTNAVPAERDIDTWDRLCSPALIERTESALRSHLTAHLDQVRARRADWKGTLAPRNGGVLSEDDYHQQRLQYERRRGQDAEVTEMLEGVLRDVKAERAQINRDAHTESAEFYRNIVRRLAVGICAHHAVSEAEGVIAEPYDRQLWSLLDEITVPHRDYQNAPTLRTMATGAWKGRR